MRILFIHPNFPGQYKHIARKLAEDPKNQVVFLTKPKPGITIPGVKKVEYKPPKEGNPGTHSYLRNLEKAVYHGQQVWRAANHLKDKGFIPDVMVAHAGWGGSLFMKDLFPNVPLLNYAEFYYRPFGADVHFHPEEKVDADTVSRIRIKNANNILNLEACDWAISPTAWQKQHNPKEFLSKISVLHEGIDTNVVKPRLNLEHLVLPSGKKLVRSDEVITYIARNFEPYRGLGTAIEAISIILKERPQAQILLVGNEGVSYGAPPKKGEKSHLQQEMDKYDLDMSRIHRLTQLPYEEFLKVLQISSAHIYLTVPFVLSWSMLEAMSAGCAIVASKTPPVEEVVADGYNAIFADFFSARDVADGVSKILDHPDRMQEMRNNARKTIIDHYALDKLLPQHITLISELASGKVPPPIAKKLAHVKHAPPTVKKKHKKKKEKVK